MLWWGVGRWYRAHQLASKETEVVLLKMECWRCGLIVHVPSYACALVLNVEGEMEVRAECPECDAPLQYILPALEVQADLLGFGVDFMVETEDLVL